MYIKWFIKLILHLSLYFLFKIKKIKFNQNGINVDLWLGVVDVLEEKEVFLNYFR